MIGEKRLKATVDSAAAKVLAAADNTRTAIVALGVGLAAVALIALAALILGARAGRKLRAA